jgi:glutathione S-transferase
MSIEIFYVSGSPYSWRVLLTAELKGIAYQPRMLSLAKHENRSPEYLKMNPRGRSPLVRDGDFIVTESLAIMVYLDRLSGNNPLFGTTAREAATIWEMLSQVVFDFEKAGLVFAEPILFGSPNANNPEPMVKGAEKLKGELKLLEERVAKTPFLCGQAITAADIAAFPLIMFMIRAAGKDIAKDLNLGILPFDKTYPALAAWVKRFEALPFYPKTYPPHWRE